MRKLGSNILPFSASRRVEQTGWTPRSFPARWLALLLMGSVGAAWALNPSLEEGGLPPVVNAGSRIVIEGEGQVVSQLMGSLLGEVTLSDEDETALSTAGGGGRRIVLASQATPYSTMVAEREKAEFLRAVEELEAGYVANGRYPALPATSEQGGVSVSYKTDGEGFTLASGHRRYTAAEGLSYGAPPSESTSMEVQGALSTTTSGWGPWKKDGIGLEAKPGVENVASLAFLEGLPAAPRWSARMFFPVDRETCGYLFRKNNGDSAYTSGELLYDGVSGSFSLKLYRANDVAAAQALNPELLETELAGRDFATSLVGEAGLLVDLGLLPVKGEGDEVVALSTSAVLPCSVSTALDGLRLATLGRHKEVLVPGKFIATEEQAVKATVVGAARVTDKLGQLHQLRLRAGRGANYDWVIGQVCELPEEARGVGFQDFGALPPAAAGTGTSAIVQAGR